MTTTYIAGPMTGLPDFNYPAFRAAAAALTEAAGGTVLDPSRRGLIEGWGWADYMRAALGDLICADRVVVLPGWRGSRGARLEVNVARQLGLPVVPLRDALKAAS